MTDVNHRSPGGRASTHASASSSSSFSASRYARCANRRVRGANNHIAGTIFD